MKSQVDSMHAELTYLNGSYRRATPLASLSIAKTHKGKLMKGASGSYTILVSNSAAASVTAGPVIVNDAPPDGLSISSMSGNGWTCDPQSDTVALNSCTRSDPLGPGAVYDPITVKVNIASNAPDNVTNTATVAGGGSATASASDTAALAAAPTGGRGGAAPHDLFEFRKEPDSFLPAEPKQACGLGGDFGTAPISRVDDLGSLENGCFFIKAGFAVATVPRIRHISRHSAFNGRAGWFRFWCCGSSLCVVAGTHGCSDFFP
jgi:uncharacterized repeat protein (TIGR01451 family)